MAMLNEDIIEETGGCGRFQIIVSVCVHFTKGLLCFTILFMMFGGIVPDWWCLDDEDARNVSITFINSNGSFYKSCGSKNATHACQNFLFDSSVRTIISEWNLVCDSAWVISTITSIQMAGLFVGNILGGQLADAIGRKPTFLGALVANTILNVVIIFSSSWLIFGVIRFFMGMICGVQLTVMYTIQCEFVPTKWRSFTVTAPSWPLFVMIFALVCWLLKDWKHVHMAAAGFGVLSVASCWFVQESFRWRVAHNQLDKSFKIIKFVAKANKVPPPSVNTIDIFIESTQQTEHPENDRRYTFVDLIRSKKLLRRTIYLSVSWFSIGLAIYSIQFGMSSLSGNFYANVVIFAALQFPLMGLLPFLQNRIGRKKTFASFLFIFIVSAATAAVAYRFEASKSRDMLSRICVLIAVSIINAAFLTVKTMTIEIYPTVVRNIGFGWQNTMARLGSIVGPQLAFVESMFPGMMYIICTIFGVLSILMLRFIPETRGVHLQDNLHQAKNTKALQIQINCDNETAAEQETENLTGVTRKGAFEHSEI